MRHTALEASPRTKSKLRTFVGSLVPPVLRRKQKPNRDGLVRFEGNYKTWAEAEQDSEKYDMPTILEKVKNAVQQVVDNKAAYERDSVLFQKIEYELPLMACLLYVANANGGRLTVADFGGSLGSTYFQHRSAIPTSIKLRWAVIEQAHYAKCGRDNFTSNQLAFYETLDECEDLESPDIILLSGVLHYLPEPHVFMESIKKRRARYVLIDKTPLISDSDRLTVQHVPPNICSSSYPAWFFNSSRFNAQFGDTFKTLFEFKTQYFYWLEDSQVPLRGRLLVRNA